MSEYLRNKTGWLVIAICLITVGALPADTYHDKPDPDSAGGITLTVHCADNLQSVIVVEPYELKTYQAKVDRRSGRVEMRGLPPGEYDLFIKTIGHVYEGLTLEADPEQSPSSAELKTMCKEVGDTFFTSEDYFNLKRIVRLTGDGEQVRMLTAQTRTKHVVTPGGQTIEAHIRRFDLVQMKKTAKVWQLVTGRHLLRQQVPYKSADMKVGFTYSPKLGGILVGERVTDLGRIHLGKLPTTPSDKYAGAQYTGS